MLQNIDEIIKRWLTAFAWCVIGHSLYQIVQLIAWAQVIAWSAQFGLQTQQLLSIILSYPFLLSIIYLIFKPKHSIAFISHISPIKMLYFPPNWLFFWIGYLHVPAHHFFQEHRELVTILIVCAVIIMSAYLVWKLWLSRLFAKRKYVPMSLSSQLRNQIMFHHDHEFNRDILEGLKQWAHQNPRLSRKQEDLQDMQRAVKELASMITFNINNNHTQFIGVVDTFGQGKSNSIWMAIETLKRDYKNTLIPVTINCAEIEKKEEIDKYIFNKIFFEVKKSIDIIGFADLPNNWLDFINGITDNKATKYFQSKKQEPTAAQMGIELEQLISHGNFHFLVVIEELEKCQVNARAVEALLNVLESLKRVRGMSLVAVFDPFLLQQLKHVHVLDYNYICDSLVHVPLISTELIMNIFQLMYCSLEAENKQHGQESAASIPFLVKNSFEAHEWAIAAKNPNELRRFIQYMSDWNIVQGQVNFVDYYMVSFINAFLPPVRNFLIQHIELIITLIKQKQSCDAASEESVLLLKQEWLAAYTQLPLEKQIVARKIIALMLGDFWNQVDYTLRYPHDVIDSVQNQRITDDIKFWQITLERKIILQ